MMQRILSSIVLVVSILGTPASGEFEEIGNLAGLKTFTSVDVEILSAEIREDLDPRALEVAIERKLIEAGLKKSKDSPIDGASVRIEVDLHGRDDFTTSALSVEISVIEGTSLLRAGSSGSVLAVTWSSTWLDVVPNEFAVNFARSAIEHQVETLIDKHPGIGLWE